MVRTSLKKNGRPLISKLTQIGILLFTTGVIALSLVIPPPPPPGPVAPYLNGIFPASTPGAAGSWELEDAFPNLSIASPLRILPFPGSEDLLILNKIGELWRVDLQAQTQDLLLDIKDRAFSKGEAGVVGVALHPKFGDTSAPDKQLVFIFYRTKPDPGVWSELGFNRLSKFSWDDVMQRFDASSEEVLLQQYDRSTWHNGGGMFFGPEGFLYLSLGDEGHEEFRAASTQKLNGGLFSGIIRIDVDNDPTRSHPIRRQPKPNANPPAGWGDTYTQGYSIPDDNPWNSADSSTLEEFYAIGIRSPYTMHFDWEHEQIWITDVGSNKLEEINLVDKADNLQWPYMEGTFASEEFQKPTPFIGNEKAVYFEYDRTVGSCIIGGGIYRGNRFTELNEKFLYADFTHEKIMALTNTGVNQEPASELLLSGLSGLAVDLPESPGITGLYPQQDGHVLVTITGEDFTLPGKILRLKQKTFTPDPPSLLSELGVFSDLGSLTPVTGVVPYGVNSPLWSDGATKRRWIALPNDGEFDQLHEQIHFAEHREWSFPEGTVFIKHFELPLSTDPGGGVARLETRFFVIGQGGGGYGLTYKWNDEGTDAVLIGGGTSSDFDIYENGQLLYTQTWDFPSRDQCMSCHNENAGYILGVNTHQLNGDYDYPHLGQPLNQLEYFDQIGAFSTPIDPIESLPRAFPIDDDSADLQDRILSYLDANCASCHRLGGVPMISLDFRFGTPLKLQNAINMPTQSPASVPDRLIIRPGDHAASELWIRDASTGFDRMPPLARNVVDQAYVDALALWIDGLSADAGEINELFLYPNPGSGWLGVRMASDWQPPFHFQVRSISGQLIQQSYYESHSVFLDLTGLTAGIYLLEVTAGENREVGKFVLE